MKVNRLSNEEFEKHISIQLPAISWLAVHGNLCLALRHPENIGPSRTLAKSAILTIEAALLALDIMDQEDIEKVHRTELDFTRLENFSEQN